MHVFSVKHVENGVKHAGHLRFKIDFFNSSISISDFFDGDADSFVYFILSSRVLLCGIECHLKFD